MISTFINPQFQSLLDRHQLNSFGALWDVAIKWFEEPNMRRGGWSGCGQLRLEDERGQDVLIYVKKQQYHGRRTWYPKHIFINPKLASNVAVIDLEKARLTTLGWYRTFFDLAALFRHSDWSKDEQLVFFEAYCGKSQLSRSGQWLFDKIQLRAAR
jgi:hypothetical protein